MDDIKVSIITPSFNQGAFIEETIRSVLNQRYSNIEYIVVDGKSTDNTIAVINKFKNLISKLIIEKDTGQSSAINKGFKLATGELVGWINSDDVLNENCVSEIVNIYKENKNAAIIYGSKIEFINSKSETIGQHSIIIKGKSDILKNYSIIQPGSFYKTEYIRAINYLNINLHYCMDLDLWLRLLNLGPILSYDSSPLAKFRKYLTNKSSTGGISYSREKRKILFRNGLNIFSFLIMRTYYQDLKYLFKSIVK
jgi:glycosyltransferase involved in cell wall biosynthesis